jgi:hypothetical protein
VSTNASASMHGPRPDRTSNSAAPLPTGAGWVVHVPVVVPDLAAALALAEQMAAWLGRLPQVDAGGMEVSAEDEQSRRVRVICDRRLSGLARCRLRHGHQEQCRDVASQAHVAFPPDEAPR